MRNVLLSLLLAAAVVFDRLNHPGQLISHIHRLDEHQPDFVSLCSAAGHAFVRHPTDCVKVPKEPRSIGRRRNAVKNSRTLHAIANRNDHVRSVADDSGLHRDPGL